MDIILIICAILAIGWGAMILTRRTAIWDGYVSRHKNDKVSGVKKTFTSANRYVYFVHLYVLAPGAILFGLWLLFLLVTR